ncbi:hypothetical protein F751_1191 [Auxenochlorella protothecoides]|uniref:Ubiquitin-like domain-containing protein n=1 Tax=Auxenochlorella protothecoides TaxID=3075 RepID=A0A087SNW0_AUXPR|nr:hypothetical protein F751_1191 [Auxenochlorella protothecoides]KFM27414.1 hypothetical protein F751_1191 [Auxenochlorella protothecoides]
MADDGITNLLIRRQDVDDFRLVNDFTAHTPIRRLKHVIEGICAIPTPHQRLLFRGRVLEDQQHLGDYGVESGSAIHLVVYPIAGVSRPTSLDIFSGLTSFFDSVEYGGSRMQDLPPLPLASAGDPWPAPTPRQLAAQEGEAGAMWQRHLLRGVRRALRNDRAHMTGLDRALRRALRRAGMPEVHDRGERGSWSDEDGSDGEDNEWESLGSEEDALLRRYLGLFGTGTGPDNPSHGVMGRRLRSLARSLLHMHCCRRTPPPVLQADLQLLQQHLAVVGAAAAELMRVAQCYAAWLGQDNAWITRAEPGYIAVLGTDWQGHASMLGSGAPSADGAGGGGGLGSLLSGMMNNPALMQMAESPAVQQMMGQILGDGAIEGGQQGHVLRGATLREAFSNLLGEVTAGGAPGRRQGSRGGRPEDDLDPSSAEALEAALATAPPELAQTWRGWITQDAAAVAAAGNLEALDQEYFRVMAPAARPSVFGSGSQ